jgi:CBS-domain-containing membrane protein
MNQSNEPNRVFSRAESMGDVLEGLARRLHLSHLQRRHGNVFALGCFAFVNGCISIGLMTLAALATGQPFIFPPLGATAFLLFHSPTIPTASPRNVIVGHFFGTVAGYFALVVTGLRNAGPALSVGVTKERVAACALAMGLTAGLMAWFNAPHPPAGATTLVVALGILRTPGQLVALMVAVLALVFQGWVLNHIAGIEYPPWRPHPMELVKAEPEPKRADRPPPPH